MPLATVVNNMANTTYDSCLLYKSIASKIKELSNIFEEATYAQRLERASHHVFKGVGDFAEVDMYVVTREGLEYQMYDIMFLSSCKQPLAECVAEDFSEIMSIIEPRALSMMSRDEIAGWVGEQWLQEHSHVLGVWLNAGLTAGDVYCGTWWFTADAMHAVECVVEHVLERVIPCRLCGLATNEYCDLNMSGSKRISLDRLCPVCCMSLDSFVCEHAARTIQSQWRECIANPMYRLCRQRLRREYEEMVE